MDASIRAQRISIINALYKNPSAFQFEMAAFILESKNACSFGKEMTVESAPFRTKNLNCFYLRASEIEKITIYNTKYNTKSLIYLQRLSISGINAPLPTPYSELILNRSVSKDDTMLDFLNIFNERLVGISYQINKRRFQNLQKTDENLFLKTLRALNGNIEGFNRKRSRLTYLFWTKEKSGVGLQVIISSFLKAEVKVLECETLVLKYKNNLPLKKYNLRLGVNSQIGMNVYMSSFAVKLIVKDYDFNKLNRFIEDETLIYEVKSAVRDYIGDFISCSLFINPKDTPSLFLRGVRLGKNSWFASSKKPDFISFNI